MSAQESGSRELRQTASGGWGRLFAEALAWVGYLAGACGLLFFGSGGFSVALIAGVGMVLAVAACVCWVAVGRMIQGITWFILLGLLFYIGNDPHGAIQSSVDSVLGPTYFGCCRQ